MGFPLVPSALSGIAGGAASGPPNILDAAVAAELEGRNAVLSGSYTPFAGSTHLLVVYSYGSWWAGWSLPTALDLTWRGAATGVTKIIPQPTTDILAYYLPGYHDEGANFAAWVVDLAGNLTAGTLEATVTGGNLIDNPAIFALSLDSWHGIGNYATRFSAKDGGADQNATVRTVEITPSAAGSRIFWVNCHRNSIGNNASAWTPTPGGAADHVQRNFKAPGGHANTNTALFSLIQATTDPITVGGSVSVSGDTRQWPNVSALELLAA